MKSVPPLDKGMLSYPQKGEDSGMIKMEGYMNIKSLAKQGYSKRAIARLTGLHRETVTKYLEREGLPVYQKSRRHSLLDSYHELIQGWLEQQNYQATRIYELTQIQGYGGSYDVVQRYVRGLKEQRDRKAYVRFETMPGQQAQVDFGDFQVVDEQGRRETVYCFVMALGYSRHMYIEFIDRCSLAAFLTCHQNAFGFFGGVPAEILYDNMKNVVIRRLLGSIEWNREFAAFAAHYGFKPLVAPPYAPWVKGKVERPIGYTRERFWRGYVFKDLSTANRDVQRWLLSIAYERIHGTTREKVVDRFLREKTCLHSLPLQPYDICEKAFRKVQKDCQVCFGANRYVLPHESVGKRILLKIKNGLIRFFDNDKLLTVYRIPSGQGQTVAHPIFYQRLKVDRLQIQRKYRVFAGKAKATRGLLYNGLQIEVAARSLADYDRLTGGGQ